MSTISYHKALSKIIVDIEGLLKDETVKKAGEEAIAVTKSASQSTQITIMQAFNHFSQLYVRYLHVYKVLEECYESIINPQLRPPIKSILELIILRILELQKELATWNPPNSHVRIINNGVEENFPWDIINFDQVLMEMKLSPDVLRIAVPRSFQEEASLKVRIREETVSAYMLQKHQRDDFYLPTQQAHLPSGEINPIYVSDFGRQAFEAAEALRQQKRRETDSTLESKVFTEDKAATAIQRIFRGRRDRQFVAMERKRELVSLGMLENDASIPITTRLRFEDRTARDARKLLQGAAKRQYEGTALSDAKRAVEETEGDKYQSDLKSERMQWLSSELAAGRYPKTLDEFYASRQPLPPPGSAEPKAAEKGKPESDKKSTKAADKKSEAKAEKKPSKGQSSAAVLDAKSVAVPKLTDSSQVLGPLAEAIAQFSSDSKPLVPLEMGDEYSLELAAQAVRPSAFDDICKRVDEDFVQRLRKLELLFSTPAKGKKVGGAKKGTNKKDKGKKAKLLPGEKLAELKGLDTSQMLSILIESKLILKTRKRLLDEFINEFDYLGSMRRDSDRRAPGTWEPEPPSLQQVRQMVLEYCILPNISHKIHASIPSENLIKSVLLYGPPGTGKIMLMEAVAHELGALLVHLSPSTVSGVFPGKAGPTSLVHMVMTVARDPELQPVVIYIDECEKMFPRGKVAKLQDGLSKLKKDLLTYKRDALTSEHRCLIIGTSSKPEEADTKDLRAFFDKFIYAPYPDYATRVTMWRQYLFDAVKDVYLPSMADNGIQLENTANVAEAESSAHSSARKTLERVDISALAFISEGYSVGAIKAAVSSVITPSRVKLTDQDSLQSAEFIDFLSTQLVSYKDDRAVFVEFTKEISGLNERRARVDGSNAQATQKATPEKKSSTKK